MLIEKSNAILLVIDIQEKLFPKVFNKKIIDKNSQILLKTCKLLELPILLTEQYPKGLGSTIMSLQKIYSEINRNNLFRFEKNSFSCFEEENIKNILKIQKKKQVLILGIETHVCILQSAFDLKAEGYYPYIITDAVGSREKNDHDSALKRFLAHGIDLITSEMVVFELLRNFKHPKFREISKLIK
ncbi:MAG: hydrolase [Rickettsiales bacterium]|nr:hydrolase [Rickettsiales bacterium]